MSAIRTVIVDDEPAAVEVIELLLKEFGGNIVIEGIARNGLDAVKVISSVKPDLVFLDVDMPVMNGLQVLEKLGPMNFEVIFTTGSSEYALKALKLKAIDYLLKPVDPADFIMAVEKARNQIKHAKQKSASGTEMVRIQLPAQNGILFVDEQDIIRVEGMGSYCHVFKTDGEKILVSRNIGQIEEKLKSNLFYRCHNSHLVNLNYVAKFVTKDGYALELTNGAQVEVSRRSKAGLLERLSISANNL